MQNLSRRSFCKTTIASAVLAATIALPTRALATAAPTDVKFAKDLKNPQPGLESAHTPAVTLEKADSASVAYGKTPAGDFYKVTIQAKHETTKDHHITGVSLYINGELVAEYKMNPMHAESSLPMIVSAQRLKAGDELLAVTDCNKHGLWGNKITV